MKKFISLVFLLSSIWTIYSLMNYSCVKCDTCSCPEASFYMRLIIGYAVSTIISFAMTVFSVNSELVRDNNEFEDEENKGKLI